MTADQLKDLLAKVTPGEWEWGRNGVWGGLTHQRVVRLRLNLLNIVLSSQPQRGRVNSKPTRKGKQMAARYALRYEIEDGTIEAPWHHMPCKAGALRAARRAAKDCACLDVVRVHVDDTRTDSGVAVFEVTR